MRDKEPRRDHLLAEKDMSFLVGWNPKFRANLSGSSNFLHSKKMHLSSLVPFAFLVSSHLNMSMDVICLPSTLCDQHAGPQDEQQVVFLCRWPTISVLVTHKPLSPQSQAPSPNPFLMWVLDLFPCMKIYTIRPAAPRGAEVVLLLARRGHTMSHDSWKVGTGVGGGKGLGGNPNWLSDFGRKLRNPRHQSRLATSRKLS